MTENVFGENRPILRFRFQTDESNQLLLVVEGPNVITEIQLRSKAHARWLIERFRFHPSEEVERQRILQELEGLPEHLMTLT